MITVKRRRRRAFTPCAASRFILSWLCCRSFALTDCQVMKVVVASVVFVAQSCLAFILRLLCLRYKAHISRENSVEMGGAYPMSSRDDGLMWLNRYDSGIRTMKVAAMLCSMGNQELPCPLKCELMQNTKQTNMQSRLYPRR